MRYTVSAIAALSLSAGIANAQGTRQLQSRSPALWAAGRQGCIAASDNADGAPVVIHDCNNEDVSKHSWSVNPWIPGRIAFDGQPGPMKIFGDKCLDVKDGINADGAKLQLWTCEPGNTNQLWISVKDETWNWAGTNKCIDLTDGNIADGNQLQLWTCVGTPGSSNQKFENTARIPNDRSDRLVLRAGDADPNIDVCLTATSNTDGARLALGNCNSGNGKTPAFPDGDEFWTYAREPLSGPIKSFDGAKCLDIPDGDATNGNKVQVWSCVEGSRNQQFRIESPWPWAITWVGEGSGNNKCLQTPNGNFTEGNEIEIWDCDSSQVSQHWF
ncbi:hypothetical protein AAF712_014559 [Marasmius tenuissimus]|uniref:Ricin B lectin domain-containing protein n=1 Tax=Marasmius tenuissimus TaxID=585030 RepID=A0ABR2ZB06_9AGAR